MIIAANVLAIAYLSVPGLIAVAYVLNLGRGVHGVDREKEDEGENPHPGQPDD